MGKEAKVKITMIKDLETIVGTKIVTRDRDIITRRRKTSIFCLADEILHQE